MYKSNDFRAGLSLVAITVSFVLLMVSTVLVRGQDQKTESFEKTIESGGSIYTGLDRITKETIESAEAIYAGTATVISDGPQDVITLPGGNNCKLKGQWKIAKFDIDHVLKGPSVQQVDIEFFFATLEELSMNRRQGVEIVPPKKRCLVFLVSKNANPPIYDHIGYQKPSCKGAKGNYELLDPIRHFTESVIFAAPEPPPQLPQKATVLERLQSELVNILMMEEPDPDIAWSAMNNIVRLNLSNKQTMRALRILSKAKNSRVVNSAVATRVQLGDKAAISELKAIVESGEGENFASAIGEVRNPECIDELKELLGSKNVSLRRSVVRALRYIKDKATLPLLEKALKDPDMKIQYDAIRGLLDKKSIADPEDYAKWQEWWKKNQDRILGERMRERSMMEEKAQENKK